MADRLWQAPTSAFDETDLELVRAQRGRVRSRRQLTRRWYRYRHSDGWFFRLDDGNRFVGVEVAAEVASDDVGALAVWSRLELELTDRRRLDTRLSVDWEDAEADLPPIMCMRCGDLYPSPPPERCSCGLELGYVRAPGTAGAEPQLLPVEIVAAPDHHMMVRVRGRADLRVRRVLTDEDLMLPGSVEERVDGAWIELQHELRSMLHDGTAALRWSDGVRCDSTTIDGSTVRRTERLVVPPAPEAGVTFEGWDQP